jgi:hypothetical protein
MRLISLLLLSSFLPPACSADEAALAVDGTRFLMDGKPFAYTGYSFFNAIYNREFNASPQARRGWLGRFKAHGINVLRVWNQWDSRRGYADTCDGCSMIAPDGGLRQAHVDTLKAILDDSRAMGMCVELALFAQESWRDGIRVPDAAMDSGVRALARELKPWRNLTLQIWNEYDYRTVEMVRVIKAEDPKRLVTNSPGVAGVLTGRDNQESLLDYLTPHTSRQGQSGGRTWEVAPRELAYLLARFRKPVVDDEPARNGTSNFGGPRDRTWPMDHILHMIAVRKAGAYVTYHHDMFQTPGTPEAPPHGGPDPQFSPYHRVVLEFLAQRERYLD